MISSMTLRKGNMAYILILTSVLAVCLTVYLVGTINFLVGMLISAFMCFLTCVFLRGSHASKSAYKKILDNKIKDLENQS